MKNTLVYCTLVCHNHSLYLLICRLINARPYLEWSGHGEKKNISRPRFTTLSAQNAIACAQDTICYHVLINSLPQIK